MAERLKTDRVKLDRDVLNQMNARATDVLGLYEYEGHVWLRLADGDGNDVLRVYRPTGRQLLSLFNDIRTYLRVAPVGTVELLRELRTVIDQVVVADEAEQQQEREEREEREWRRAAARFREWQSRQQPPAEGESADPPDATDGEEG